MFAQSLLYDAINVSIGQSVNLCDFCNVNKRGYRIWVAAESVYTLSCVANV